MFELVIVGVEGRAGGRDAIALARLLAPPGGTLALAHVHEPGADRAARSRALLERERAMAEVDAELVPVAAPSPARGLRALARERGADLLVVGSCGRGAAGRVLLGNDTLAALEHPPCPVAVAPRDYAHDLRGLATIGVGYDGSPESVAALALARALGDRLGARLRALEVIRILSAPWVGTAGVAGGRALEELAEAARRELAALPGLDADAVVGLAAEELAGFSERVDLLVVGSRGLGPLRRLLLGSTSAHLAGHARAPLLVVGRPPGAGA